MSTVADTVRLSLRDIGVLDGNETPTADMMSDSIATLNQMLAMWQISPSYLFCESKISHTPTGAVSYTIGPLADINTSRPANVNSAYFSIDSIDYPIEILHSFEKYNDIAQKTLDGSAYPTCLFYNPSYPFGTIYLYPNTNLGQLNLIVPVQLPSYTGSTENLLVPAEYELVIRYSLSELLAAMFGTPLRADIAQLGLRARRMMMINNFKCDELKLNYGSGLSNYGRMLGDL